MYYVYCSLFNLVLWFILYQHYNMDYTITSLFFIALTILFIINKNSANEFTAKGYAINTYLYILLGITITTISTIIIHRNVSFKQIESPYFSLFISLVVLVILIYVMVTTSNTHRIKVTMSWLLFMITIGFIITPYYKLNKDETQSYIYSSLFLLTLSFMWWMKTQMNEIYKFNMYYVVTFVAGLLLLTFFGMKIYEKSSFVRQYKKTSIMVFIFCSLFIIHDTQNMINRGNAIEHDLNSGIINKSDLSSIVNYQTQTTTLYLGGINLLSGKSGKY